MNDFWKSYDITALEYGVNYQCYPLYGRIHLTELALSLIFILSAALWYRHSGPNSGGASWWGSRCFCFLTKRPFCSAWP